METDMRFEPSLTFPVHLLITFRKSLYERYLRFFLNHCTCAAKQEVSMCQLLLTLDYLGENQYIHINMSWSLIDLILRLCYCLIRLAQ